MSTENNGCRFCHGMDTLPGNQGLKMFDTGVKQGNRARPHGQRLSDCDNILHGVADPSGTTISSPLTYPGMLGTLGALPLRKAIAFFSIFYATSDRIGFQHARVLGGFIRYENYCNPIFGHGVSVQCKFITMHGVSSQCRTVSHDIVSFVAAKPLQYLHLCAPVVLSTLPSPRPPHKMEV